MTAREKYIIRKDNCWVKSSRPDLLDLQIPNLFSQYLYDAKEFDTRREAKKAAMKIGGEVWLFDRITGRKELAWRKPEEGARCDTCRKYAGYDGECKNPKSEYYRIYVGINDVCDEWTEKHKIS